MREAAAAAAAVAAAYEHHVIETGGNTLVGFPCMFAHECNKRRAGQRGHLGRSSIAERACRVLLLFLLLMSAPGRLNAVVA